MDWPKVERRNKAVRRPKRRPGVDVVVVDRAQLIDRWTDQSKRGRVRLPNTTVAGFAMRERRVH